MGSLFQPMKERDGNVYCLSVLILRRITIAVVRQYAGRLEGNKMVLNLSTLPPELLVILSFPIVSKRQSNCEIMSKSFSLLRKLELFKVK